MRMNMNDDSKRNKKRILVIDDDEYIVDAISQLLEMKDYKVYAADSLHAFMQMNQREEFDMYLVDVYLPDGDGFEICKQIRQGYDKPVIFLTSCDDEESVTKGLDMGADDYVTKPFRSAELLARMNAVARRMTRKEGNTLSVGNLVLNPESYRIEKNGQEIKLSTVEYELLLVLVNSPGLIVRREKLFEKLWDKNGNFVEDNTLTVNISRLKSKLGIDHRTGKSYIETIRGVGYRFVE